VNATKPHIKMNFRQLDLNLLRVLGAVYRSGSVTEAGRQLALSQPATSNALARLRRYFDDALFVPSPGGLHPTRLARRIAPGVMALLRELEAELLSGESFDPATEAAHWRLSLSDLGEQLFLPRLAHWLRREAPASTLANVSIPALHLPAALEAMDVDLAIGILNPEHRGVASESLFHEHFVALTAADWQPRGGRAGATLTRRQLAAAALVVADPAATMHGSVQQMLARLQIAERAVLRVRHYGAMVDLVADSDLLAIVPQMYADTLATGRAVRVWELPGHGPHYDVRMVWHHSATADPAQAWLRGCVRQLYARAAAPARRGGAKAP
jgi:DNA-binding transcriptional LysR family regulator